MPIPPPRRPFRFTASALLPGAIFAGALLGGCALPWRLPGRHAAPAPTVQLDVARFAQIDAAIDGAIAAHQLPGAVFHLEHGDASYERAYGKLSYEAGAAPVTSATLFDAASLTKVLATAPAVLRLAEQGRIGLDDKLIKYFPDCANNGKETITIRQLLTHSSGLPAGLPATLPSGRPWRGRAAAHALACEAVATTAPGTAFRYSDINYILLGELVEQVTGTPLEDYVHAYIHAPLQMHDTGYLPLRRGDAQAIAPTQLGGAGGGAHGDLAPGEVLRGVVHDPTVRRMGGVGGSAGVFTTVGDVTRFARMVLGGGMLDGVRVLSPESVRLLTTVQSPPGLAPHGLGMDIDSPYAVRPRGKVFPVGSFGHTGFTGCVLWIDPGSRAFYVLLSNRVYPDDRSNILDLYTRLGTLSAQAAGLGR